MCYFCQGSILAVTQLVSFFSIVRLIYFFLTTEWQRAGSKLFNPCKVRPDMKISFHDYFHRTTSKSFKENPAFEFFSAGQQDKLALLLCYSGNGRISLSTQHSQLNGSAIFVYRLYFLVPVSLVPPFPYSFESCRSSRLQSDQ